MKLPGVRSIVLIGCMAVAVLAAGVLTRSGAGQGTQAPAKARTAESEYLVEVSHTPEQIVQAMDGFSANPKYLPLWHWGCQAGEHKGWIIVRAADEQTALAIVPASLRGEAKIHKLNTFTLAELKSFHEHGH